MVSEAVKLERERRKTARVLANAALQRECLRVLCDPLWSSVLGFVAVHEARKLHLVGPVADDMLYAGIIAINTSRAGLIKEASTGATGVLHEIVGGVEGTASSLVKLLPMAVG